MRPNLVWTPQARKDLLDLYVVIGLDNPSAAEKLYTGIEDHISLLTIHPRLGVRRPEIAPSARMLIRAVTCSSTKHILIRIMDSSMKY